MINHIRNSIMFFLKSLKTKNAGLEIERKFLVDVLPEGYKLYKNEDIVQHYLSTSDPEIRVRSKNNIRFFVTRKTAGDMIRAESEIEISREGYLALATCSKAKIIKTRYYLEEFELDVYHNIKDLVTVEVEFKTEKEAKSFIPPEWFGLEVTYDERYKNKNLAIVNEVTTIGISRYNIKKDK